MSLAFERGLSNHHQSRDIQVNRTTRITIIRNLPPHSSPQHLPVPRKLLLDLVPMGYNGMQSAWNLMIPLPKIRRVYKVRQSYDLMPVTSVVT
jgi:hypothetical protein